jgi:hypothetical protein
MPQHTVSDNTAGELYFSLPRSMLQTHVIDSVCCFSQLIDEASSDKSLLNLV